MKKLLVFLLLSVCFSLSAQDELKRKYSLVQYNESCGGWYFLSYNKGGQQLYGFADRNGNVVATDASQYRLHTGYIELYLLDLAAKSKHDQWIEDVKMYERAYREYMRINKKYDAELAAYKSKYQAAEAEAERRWKRAREYARQKAEYENKKIQSQTANTGVLGAILGGVASVANVTAAVNAVKYEPYLNEVLLEYDLLSAPEKPYNPMPTKPVEPPTGYFWKSFSLRQPCKYDSVDFESISESGNYADVRYDGKWGLVNSMMEEVIACTSSDKVLVKKYDDGKFLIRSCGKYAVIDKEGKYVLPMEFSSIERHRMRFKVSKGQSYGLYSDEGREIIPCEFEKIEQQQGYWLCRKNSKWGVYTRDFVELYPCQFQDVKLVSNAGVLVLYNKNKSLWGALDFNSGKELLPNNYSSIEFSSHRGVGSLYKVCTESKYGLYSDKGVVIIPCAYSNINIKEIANKTMVEVKNGVYVGLYEPSGILALPDDKYINYEAKGSYYFVTNLSKQVGVCDVFGNELVPCKYSSLEYNLQLQAFMASKGLTKGVVSVCGQEIFPFVNVARIATYDKNPNVLLVDSGDYKGKGYGAVDYDGNLVVPMKSKYDKLSKKVDKAIKKNPSIPKISEDKRTVMLSDLASKEKGVQEAVRQRTSFSFFAKNYVERVIGEWQKKGEFEKVDEWRKRVNNSTLNQRVFALTKEAQDLYVDECRKLLPADAPRIVGAYDPDNETYRISTKYSTKDILVKVDNKDALEFKTAFNTLRREPKFFVENDRVGLAEYVFVMPDGQKYKYSNEASLKYTIADVKYNFDAIEIDKSALNNGGAKGRQVISTSTLTFGKSDVDYNIPTTEIKRPNTFALIIANENYDNERKVDHAYNDGQVLRDYCVKTLGIPSENIHFRADATLNHIKFEVGWLKTVTKAYPDAKILLYYAGHGMPDAYTRESYLLPVDGYSSEVATTGYKLSELYASLGELPADNVLVMLDACFTGVDRTGEAVLKERGVKVVPKSSTPGGKVVVFAATSEQQPAQPYDDQGHGLFTYFLLKKLQDSKGELTYGDWFDYISTKVPQKASVMNNCKAQNPTVIPSPIVRTNWKTINL